VAVVKKIFCTVSRITKKYPFAGSKSIGFPKLEDGLSILSKDELADSLAYNSIKV
jgi:hypothetical protein